MITVNKETLAVLRRLGLNQYESKTYLALSQAGSSTATELSDSAGIPRPRVYDVLAKLEKKGFVVINPGRPTRYSVVPVSTAIASLKKERKDTHLKEIDELEKLEERLLEYIEIGTGGGAIEEDVFMIKDRRNIYATLSDLITNAKEHIIVSSHKEGLQRKREEFGAMLHKAKNRGVDVKLVEDPRRMAIIDHHSMIFLANDTDSKNDRAAWVKSKFVANSLKQTF